MEKQRVSYFNLEGTYEEIGRQMARKMAATPALQYMKAAPIARITKQDVKDGIAMYKKYCPGLIEELEGFSDESGIPVDQIAFTWMTYLVPGCSGLILAGDKSSDGHTKLIRNYEFSIEDEDLAVSRTAPKGKYAHIAGNIAFFGRCEGINECGLAVSQSSCGFPVSNLQGMRLPKIKGLQFWAVIRTILENCKDVSEALQMAKEMPIAYNINLFLADEKGNGALLETMDGKKAWKTIESEHKSYLCGTNHIVIPEFRIHEPVAMRNSMIRYKALHSFAESKQVFEEKEVRKFMLTDYPEGMTAHFFKDWFGTIKTVVMDCVERRFSVCWFGEKENGFTDLYVNREIPDITEEKSYLTKKADPSMFEMVPIMDSSACKSRV